MKSVYLACERLESLEVIYILFLLLAITYNTKNAESLANTAFQRLELSTKTSR